MAKGKAGYVDTYTEMPGMGIHALGPNAVVVTRGAGWTAEQASAFRDALRADVLLVHLAGEADTIESLDEGAMAARGWVRVDRVNALIRQVRKEPSVAAVIDDDPRDNPIEDFMPGGKWYEQHPEDRA